MKNNPKEIDTKYETIVAIFRTALNKRNFWKVTVWLSIISASLIVFFLNGGMSVLMAVFGINKAGVK
jgi:hypothetical protein